MNKKQAAIVKADVAVGMAKQIVKNRKTRRYPMGISARLGRRDGRADECTGLENQKP